MLKKKMPAHIFRCSVLVIVLSAGSCELELDFHTLLVLTSSFNLPGWFNDLRVSRAKISFHIISLRFQQANANKKSKKLRLFEK